MVCSYNNNANQRVEYNLNSIFRQNYSNYFAVIINDLSNDGTDTLYRKYFDFYNISKDKYVYIENHLHKTAMENIYDAELNYCSEDSITLTLDGDDELIGRNAIKLFNANYHRLQAGYLYSNYYYFDSPAQIIIDGISTDHSL
jgi:glycosyltransferase involved in cell wall biosynthesis